MPLIVPHVFEAGPRKPRVLIDFAKGPVNVRAMDADEALSRKPNPLADLGKQDLDPLSVAELDERIATLVAEIERVETHKRRAVNHRAIADELFKR